MHNFILKLPDGSFEAPNSRDCFVRHVDLYPDTDIQTQRMFIRAGGGPGTFFSTHGNHLP